LVKNFPDQKNKTGGTENDKPGSKKTAELNKLWRDVLVLGLRQSGFEIKAAAMYR